MIANDVRPRLEEERRRVSAAVVREDAELATSLEDKGEDLTASQHPADVASDLALRERTLQTDLTLRAEVAELDSALDRLARGTYGRCVECGAAIDPERLAVLPQAARCISCQRLLERSG
jgi:RNA polymerase-binding transcription factor DksA